MSPEYLIPPSAISGTPAPLTTRVVQMDPGPIPTFTPSTPRSMSHFVLGTALRALGHSAEALREQKTALPKS